MLKPAALLIASLIAPQSAQATGDIAFPQEGVWSCVEPAVISGHEAIVRSEVSYPAPGRFESEGIATLYLPAEKEVRIALTGAGDFTVDGDQLTSVYTSISAVPTEPYGFTEAETDYLHDWQAYLISGFEGIKGRVLDQFFRPHSENSFDLVAIVGGEEKIVSCQRQEDLIG